MKIDIPLAGANKLINNGPCVFVTCAGAERPNVFAVSWTMPVSIAPPLVAISCVKSNLSHALIAGSREFGISVPEVDLLDALYGTGKLSGRDTDKFARFRLTPEPGRVIQAPSVGECPGVLECRLVGEPVYGDFTIFVGEVVAAYADPAKFDTRWKPESARLLNHLGDEFFQSGAAVIRATAP